MVEINATLSGHSRLQVHVGLHDKKLLKCIETHHGRSCRIECPFMELVMFIHAITKEKLLQARADDERDQNSEIAYMYIYVTVTKTDIQIG